MDKRRLDSLERQIRVKTGKTDYPPPGFFRKGDPAISEYRETLLKQGFTLEAVNKTPVFIEGE
jgi:hypothetical protein